MISVCLECKAGEILPAHPVLKILLSLELVVRQSSWKSKKASSIALTTHLVHHYRSLASLWLNFPDSSTFPQELCDYSGGSISARCELRYPAETRRISAPRLPLWPPRK